MNAGEVALEADLVDDLLHLAADARHLRQAELVDLVGGQVGGCEPADASLIPRLAAREIADTHGVAGSGQVLLAEEIVEAPVRRHDHLS